MQTKQNKSDKHLQCKYNSNLWYNVLFFSSIAICIWFFISLLIPVVYNIGGTLTPFYSRFNGSFTLSAFGIISVIVLCAYFIQVGVSISKIMKLKTHKYDKLNKNTINKIYYSLLIILFILIIAFVIQSYVPPKVGSTSETVTYYTANWGYNSITSSFFHNWIYYLNIVLFSLFLIFSIPSLFIFSKINKNQKFLEKFKENKKFFKELIEKIKENKKQKAANKEKRKRLLEEEDELLENLKNVVVDEETKSMMSQEELLEKINERNKIKNQILDNHKEQDKLSALNVLKPKKQKTEVINKRTTKLKKQEIAVPDKELEEIFKNLEID